MKKTEEYMLTSENIDSVSENIVKFLEKLKISSKETIKIRYKAEEMMRFYQIRLDTDSTFTVKYTTGIERRITFYFEGEKAEPFDNSNDEFIENLIKNLGELDSFQYKHNTNIVSMKIPKRQISQITKIAFALLLVALFTLATKCFIPENITNVIQKSFISPTASLLISLLRSLACILIFTSITIGIVNIGDVRSFKQIGKTMIYNLFLFTVISAVVTLACLIPWMNFSFDTGSKSGIFDQISKTAFDMIPTNPISPFIDGNAIQVIVLAIFCGVVFSLLGEKVSILKKALQQLDTFISYTIEIINILLPLLVFVVIQDTILTNNVSAIFKQRTVALLWVVAIAVQFVLNSVFIGIFGKMSVKTYFKKAKSPLIISLLTSSSVVALPTNMDVCKNELGINKKLVDFGAPLGQVMFMPCSAAVIIATCIGVSFVAGIEVAPVWIITLIIISVVLAVATPPIPGGASLIYSLMFTQMGLPFEYFGITIAIATIADGMVTTLNIFGLHNLLLKINNKRHL